MARSRRRTVDTANSASHEKRQERDRATSAAGTKKEPQRKRPRPSQKGEKKRRRVSKGVYSDRYGLAATVKVNGMQRERRFPRGTPIRTIQAWRDEVRGSLRTLPKGAKHTLRYDAERYVKQKGSVLVSIKDRRRNLYTWMERFGHIRTLAIEQHIGELNEQLYEWRRELSGATCNHRRDALMNLVRVLYGSKAASGLSDLVTFRKAPPKPRGLDRKHIAEVIQQVEPGSKLRARLELLQWTGMRPSQMGRLAPKDFKLDAEVPHVVVARGKGGKAAAVPLLEEGIAAARDFIAIGAFGEWKSGPANRELAKAATRAGRPAFTTYQIRHSFATGLRQSGADIADIQDLYGHVHAEMTKIYAPAQMEKHREAIERLRAADGTAAQPKGAK